MSFKKSEPREFPLASVYYQNGDIMKPVVTRITVIARTMKEAKKKFRAEARKKFNE